MKLLTIKYLDFAEKVYKLKFQNEYGDYIDTANVDCDLPIDLTKDEITLKADQFKVSNKQIEKAIKTAMRWNYESSYAVEFDKALHRELRDKVNKDLTNIQKLMEIKFAYEIKDNSADQNWNRQDEITIEIFNINAFASIIIECINGYGIFNYKNTREFYETNANHSKTGRSHQDKTEAILSHLFWLKYTEEIYGSIFNLFQFSTNHIDYYGTMGNTDYTDEDLKSVLDFEGILAA